MFLHKMQFFSRLNHQDCLKNLGLLELKTEISSDIFLYAPVTYPSQLSLPAESHQSGCQEGYLRL